MEKAIFKTRLLEAAIAARDFARKFILEPLPDDLAFRVRLNSSYDGNPLHGDEVVFPEDGSLERAESAAELALDGVVDLLWRERRVPEWIDVSVIGETGARTVLEVLSCGRYTENEEFLYHQHEGRPPFHVTGPDLPVDYEEGNRFSIHLRAECWSSRDVEDLRRHATKAWSLELCGRQFQDAELASLPVLPSVEILELRGVRVEGPGLAGLAQAPKLRVLRAHFADINELDLTKLPVLPELQSCDLNGLPASVRGFHRIGEVAASLESLSLGAAVSPEFDGPMPVLPGLSSLTLILPRLGKPNLEWGRGLRTISLHVHAATDDEVVALAQEQPHLEALHLRRTSVSDALLREALRWPSLRFLDVVDTKVTQQALESFEKKRPEVKVLPRRLTSKKSHA